MNEQSMRNQILSLVAEYADTHHRRKPFKEGDRISYAGRIYGKEEMVNLVDSALDFWLTAGRYTDTFESEFAKYLGVKYCSLVNSGSSANLLAFMALTSHLLGDRAIKRGDEVITVAAGFPTTVSPVVQFGTIPVFVDINIPQYNIDESLLDLALSEKTKAVFLAHTLGNPFNIAAVKSFCDKNNLWLIEDNCDALGSKYILNGEEKFTGSFGDIATSSFYPPHHITMGEGGAVYTNNPVLHKIVRSMRDWGRDCQCPPGIDNICNHRFDSQYGELPVGYDHKYVYSHFGYNLKATDMQASIGVAQLKRLSEFIETRRRNFERLKNALKIASDKLILPEPCANSAPSWFGFLITCKTDVNRNDIVCKLEEKGIQTRMLFAGNIIRHPCFDKTRDSDADYRVVGELTNTNHVMNNTFWVGVYPGMSDETINYIAKSLLNAIN